MIWGLLLAVGMASVSADSYICESTKQAVTIDTSLTDSSLVPPYPTAETPEISVIIESYRDTQCGETINNLFKNAKNPKNLRIGVINHVNVEPPVDTDCVAQYCAMHPRSACPYHDQIRKIIINRREYRGHETALVQADKLIGDTEFFLMVSPGVSAAPHWDASLLSQWGAIKNEFAILSSPLPLASNKDGPVQYSIGRTPRPLPPTTASLSSALLSNTFSSEFVFGKSHAIARVPYDPQLIRLDTTYTDALRFARLWTHGYDIYTWATPVLFKMAVTAPNEEWARFGMTPGVIIKEFDASLNRLKAVLGMSPVSASTLVSIKQYGLGVLRSLDELSRFMMVDLRGGKVYTMRCEQLHRVPYAYSAATTDPYSDPTSIWGLKPSLSTSQPSDLISIPLSSISKPVAAAITISTTPEHDTPRIPVLNEMNGILDVAVVSTDSFVRSALHIDTPLLGVKIFLLALPIFIIALYVAMRACIVMERGAEQVISSYRVAKDT